MNEQNLLFTVSPFFYIDKKRVFHVHIEDRSDLSKYVYANIIMPDNKIIEYSLLEDSDLNRLRELCEANADLLEERATSNGYCDPLKEE